MDFRMLAVIMLGAALANNFALRQFLSICPFLGVTREMKSAAGMSVAVIFVMVLATAITWPVYTYLLHANGMAYLTTVVFILVIAALVQFVEITLRRYVPALYNSLGVYLPLITTNCAILGVTILNVNKGYGFVESIVNAFGAGLGLFLAMVIFCGVRNHTEGAKPPKPFAGMPITLISLSILSLAFYGFMGVIENMFG